MCLLQGDLSTGSCFHGIRRYVRRHKGMLRFCILENVPGLLRPSPLGLSNADLVVEFLREEGFLVQCWLLCPRNFGTPQRRKRLWFLAINSATLAEVGLDGEQARQALSNCMNGLVGSQMQHVDSYLLEENNPAVRQYFLECAAASVASASNVPASLDVAVRANWGVYLQPCRPRASRKATCGPKHYKYFVSNSLDWQAAAGPDDATAISFPGLQRLHRREYDILYAQGVRSYPEAETRILECSQGIGRNQGECSPHCCPPMTPDGRKYVTSRCRFLLGCEQLRLQNIWMSTTSLSVFPNTLLTNLAGNAFECSCLSAVVFCFLDLLSHSDKCLPSIPQSVSPALPCTDDEESTDLDLQCIWQRGGARPWKAARLTRGPQL